MLIFALSILSGFIAAGAVWYSWELYDNIATLRSRRRATELADQQAPLHEEAPENNEGDK